MKKLIPLLIFLLLFVRISAQEVLSGLYFNPVIKSELARTNFQSSSESQRFLEDIKPLILPFFDDFQQKGVYPDTSRWVDNEVFINSDFPYHSANVGAATFDALDAKGNLYPDASHNPFLADHLTSKPIRLDSVFLPTPKAITVADSVFFSFYYQPQGRGNAPEEWDSLVLQFGYNSDDSVIISTDSILVPLSNYIQPGDTIFPLDTLYAPSTCDSGIYMIATTYYIYSDTILIPCKDTYGPKIEWITVWSTRGMTLDTFNIAYKTYSKQILIPITDSLLYYKKDFRFRFYNYCSLATNNVQSWRSNCDQWNVDYIFLNTGRSESDSTYRDISFVEKAPSMLRRYQVMPYNQFKNDPTNSMKDSIRLYISNLYNEAFNTDYGYYVNEIDGPFSFYHDGGGCNLPPFYDYGYQRCDATCGASRACPKVDFFYPISNTNDSAEFEIKHIISGFTAADTISDTISFSQNFYNYYAYDDGTPEAGYGVNTPGGKVAIKFLLNKMDTLRAIRMFFNRTEGDANDVYFDLVVWRDNDGEPGEMIHNEVDLKPIFSENLYQIQTYYLKNPVPVNKTFYIGWEQTTSDNLNVGFDTYNDASSSIFYNVYGTWANTSYQGSVIMRPVVGREFDPTGLSENNDVTQKLVIYPNPCNCNLLKIIIENGQIQPERGKLSMNIYNIYGQEILSTEYKRELDVSSLANGIYIIQVYDDNYNTKVLSGKFIISR